MLRHVIFLPIALCGPNQFCKDHGVEENGGQITNRKWSSGGTVQKILPNFRLWNAAHLQARGGKQRRNNFSCQFCAQLLGNRNPEPGKSDPRPQTTETTIEPVQDKSSYSTGQAPVPLGTGPHQKSDNFKMSILSCYERRCCFIICHALVFVGTGDNQTSDNFKVPLLSCYKKRGCSMSVRPWSLLAFDSTKHRTTSRCPWRTAMIRGVFPSSVVP